MAPTVTFDFGCAAFVDLAFGIWDRTEVNRRFITDFLPNWSKLQQARDRWVNKLRGVENQIENAESRQKVATETLKKWKHDVEDKLALMNHIFDHPYPKTCPVGGYCYKNYFYVNALGEQLYFVLKMMEELEANGDLEESKMFAPAPAIELEEEEEIVGMEESLLGFWAYFERYSIIGIHGMGGVGKSSLLKKINNELCKNIRGFDKVIWINLSIATTGENIQDAIAERLGLSFTGKESQTDRKDAILSGLNDKRFVLLLDHLQKPVPNLSKLGVPTQKKK